MATAILVDLAFFLARFPTVYPGLDGHDPEVVGRALFDTCIEHVNRTPAEKKKLHRILIYDCPPLDKKSCHPLTQKDINFLEIPIAKFRKRIHDYLKCQRKVALRLGYLTGYHWRIKSGPTKLLLSGKIKIEDLKNNDVKLDIVQKSVDMKLGLDIATMSLKRQVDQIVLISGDGDFVPAAKLARREGIDVVLDPLWAPIGDALHEHVDGIRTIVPNPAAKKQ